MMEEKFEIQKDWKYSQEISGTWDHLEMKMESTWGKIKDSFRRDYPVLTENDLEYDDQGDFSNMLGRIGHKIGMTASQVRNKILRWEDAYCHFF